MMECPWCSEPDVNFVQKEERMKDDSMPDVSFLDLVFKCDKCGYSFNCVGAKQINIS